VVQVADFMVVEKARMMMRETSTLSVSDGGIAGVGRTRFERYSGTACLRPSSRF
jgi:hypothetical protein